MGGQTRDPDPPEIWDWDCPVGVIIPRCRPVDSGSTCVKAVPPASWEATFGDFVRDLQSDRARTRLLPPQRFGPTPPGSWSLTAIRPVQGFMPYLEDSALAKAQVGSPASRKARPAERQPIRPPPRALPGLLSRGLRSRDMCPTTTHSRPEAVLGIVRLPFGGPGATLRD